MRVSGALALMLAFLFQERDARVSHPPYLIYLKTPLPDVRSLQTARAFSFPFGWPASGVGNLRACCSG